MKTNKETSIKYNGDTYIVKSQYDYDSYELRLNKDKEIERLNNVINELEKWLNKIIEITANLDEKGTCKNVLIKVQELKEGK